MLQKGGDVSREWVRQEYITQHFERLAKAQRATIQDWSDQIPVLGFNSGKYDLKVIKKYFVTHIGTEDKVISGQQARKDFHPELQVSGQL